MNKLTLTLLFSSFSLCLFSQENQINHDTDKLFVEAANSWKDSRAEDAVKTYQYILSIESDEKKLVEATRNIAILLNDMNRPLLAKIYIEKIQAMGIDDPYLRYEKGLLYYSMKDFPHARKEFQDIPTITGDRDLIYNSIFMKGMTEMELSGPLKAMEDFQNVYEKYPYMLSPSSYMIALCYEKLKKRSQTIDFLKNTLLYDNQNLQALIKLAQTYEEVGYYLPSWQSFYTLSELDNKNSYFSKMRNKLLKIVAREKKPDNLLYWSRLAWPVHSEELKMEGRTQLRIGLYAKGPKELANLLSFSFISNSEFDIIDSKLGKTFNGKKAAQYTITYIEKDRLFELRDMSNSRLYTTRNNFSIIPKNKNEVFLIKSPEFPESTIGVDRSDKELSGSLDVKVSTEGMKLINRTFSEHIIPGIISKLDISKDNLQFLKALSIVVRTILLDYAKEPTTPSYDFSDNMPNLKYVGLQYENPLALNAAKETLNQTLNSGYIQPLSFHKACGGKTHNGADDNSSIPEILTPWSLNTFFSSSPKQNLYCLPDDTTLYSEVLWSILLDPYWIEERINSKYKIGAIKNIEVLKRRNDMQIESIKITGSARDAVIEDIKEINWVLSGNTFRSDIYTLRPIFNGKNLKLIIVKGVGTGDLRNFCLNGAYKLAKDYGYSYIQILKHYFPQTMIKGLDLNPKNIKK